MDCNEIIQSNDYLDVLVATDEVQEAKAEPACIQRINDRYEIWYYNRASALPLSFEDYTYSAIPNCFGLLDSGALDSSGILQMQNQPTLSLKGQGVIVGFLDTGIDYTNERFRNSDGTTRILAMWDQSQDVLSDSTRVRPAAFQYGTEYRATDINDALQSEQPDAIVPERDENGHGTYLASIACGSPDQASDFTGAAPLSDILVVKLKPAKQYLKDFYFIPESTLAYQENDIMTAIAWMEAYAEQVNKPLVVCIGIGTNNGSHSGSSILSDYLNQVGSLRKRAIVVATGNEANARHHFKGGIETINQSQTIEINVEQNMKGFYVELWANAPEIFAVSLRSPTGEMVPKIIPRSGGHQEYDFVFEDTEIVIDYRIVGRTRADQLVYIQFRNAAKGIWQVNVFPESVVTGNFNMWLPMRGMLEHDVFFLESSPEITLTTPSAARIPISVGGYDHRSGGLYLDSGRGFTAAGDVKPSFTAPAVNIQGSGLRNNYVENSGTSAAAAITAGACAQVMEWAVVRGRDPSLNTVEIKNLLIRGCVRNPELAYPNPSWGYGKLNVFEAFENIVGLG